jgi:hypothetical protein
MAIFSIDGLDLELVALAHLAKESPLDHSHVDLDALTDLVVEGVADDDEVNRGFGMCRRHCDHRRAWTSHEQEGIE